jgi:hypothetical protein
MHHAVLHSKNILGEFDADRRLRTETRNAADVYVAEEWTSGNKWGQRLCCVRFDGLTHARAAEAKPQGVNCPGALN